MIGKSDNRERERSKRSRKREQVERNERAVNDWQKIMPYREHEECLQLHFPEPVKSLKSIERFRGKIIRYLKLAI